MWGIIGIKLEITCCSLNLSRFSFSTLCSLAVSFIIFSSKVDISILPFSACTMASVVMKSRLSLSRPSASPRPAPSVTFAFSSSNQLCQCWANALYKARLAFMAWPQRLYMCGAPSSANATAFSYSQAIPAANVARYSHSTMFCAASVGPLPVQRSAIFSYIQVCAWASMRNSSAERQPDDKSEQGPSPSGMEAVESTSISRMCLNIPAAFW